MALAFTERFGTEDLIFGTDLRDLEIAVQGGEATLYAATGLNGGFSRWQLQADGSTPQLAGQQLHGQAGLRTGDFELAQAGGQLRLLQGGTSQSSLTFYQLQAGGGLGSQQQDSLAGAGAGGFGAVAMLELAGGQAAFYAIGGASGRLQGWRLDADGAVQGQAAAGGSSSAYSLEPGALLAAVETPGGPVLLAADSQGVHGFRADAASGALSPGGSLGAGQGLSVSTLSALETFAADGQGWALLAAAGSSSLTLIRVAADGELQFAAQLQDTAMTRFGGISALEVVEAEGHVLVLAAGNDGGLSLFTLTPGGELIHLQSLEHQPGMGLQNATALEAVAADGQLQVFAASGTEAGISRFTLPLAELGARGIAAAQDSRLEGGSAGDVLEAGSSGADLYGFGGDDVLVAGPGGGALTGGSGADIFVLDPAASQAFVQDFTPGEDLLDLSLFEGLYSPAQLQVKGRSQGIRLLWEDMVIYLNSADGSRLALEDVFGPSLRFSFPGRQAPGVTLPGGGYYGSGGRDRLEGTSGRDALYGLGGSDRLEGLKGGDRLWGGNGGDSLAGGAGRDRLDGGEGRDRLEGGEGDDRLEGGAGSDTLQGGGGGDVLKGGAAADLLRGGSGKDVLLGQGGDDLLAGGSEGDLLEGGEGEDSLEGGAGRDRLDGGEGRDRLEGGEGNDRLEGGAGSDTLQGGGGGDVLKGGAAADLLRGGSGKDVLLGQGGDDLLAGGSEGDLLEGGEGEDSLEGGAGRDRLDGGEGRDRLEGGEGNDRLEGGAGRDTLQGGGGGDVLKGGAAADLLRGGSGEDVLLGQGGDDLLLGGAGADVFVFASGDDTIADFAAGADRISLAGTGAGSFAELGISRQDGGTLISSGSGSLFLENLRPGQLDADDFLF